MKRCVTVSNRFPLSDTVNGGVSSRSSSSSSRDTAGIEAKGRGRWFFLPLQLPFLLLLSQAEQLPFSLYLLLLFLIQSNLQLTPVRDLFPSVSSNCNGYARKKLRPTFVSSSSQALLPLVSHPSPRVLPPPVCLSFLRLYRYSPL